MMRASLTPLSFKHDVFISYSRHDEKFATELQRSLQHYKAPKEIATPQRRLSIFRDKNDLTAGDYYKKLAAHLSESAALIVICSPDARRSQYVNDEIRRFAELRGGDRSFRFSWRDCQITMPGRMTRNSLRFLRALSI